MSFLNSTGEWASVSGEAAVIADRDVVRKYYNSTLRAWVGDLGDGVHDGGPEDPRIGVIRVVARTATYAIAVGTSLGRGFEIVKSAATGQAAEVNKLRELTEQELNECKSLAVPFVRSRILFFLSPPILRLQFSNIISSIHSANISLSLRA